MQAIKNFVTGRTDETEIQSGKEPVSGQTGAGTTNEPYDAGNTTGDSSLGGSAPSESTHGSSNTNVEDTFSGSTSGSSNSSTGGVENTFGRDRGGPTPGNKGPHSISIANKLDPNVDSDGDGKPRSGPADIEHATVGHVSTTSGQMGSSAGYSSNATGSTSNYDSTSNYGSSSHGNNTDNTSGEIAGEAPSAGYSSSAQGRNTSSHDNPTATPTPGSGPSSSNIRYSSTSNPHGQVDLSRAPSGIQPDHQTANPGVTSPHSHTPHSSTQPPPYTNQSSVSNLSEARSPIAGLGAVEPSVAAADFSSGYTQPQKQQGGDRPLEEPSGQQIDAVRGEKEANERQQAGGDAAGGAGGPMSQGMGEQWVKSTGMAADGGDFDAAKPGAGREADRLMELKGVRQDD